MIQMASVFGEQERSILRDRVMVGLERVRQQGKKLGRPKVSPKVEDAIRKHLSAGNGILKVAAMVGVGSGTVQRVKREIAGVGGGGVIRKITTATPIIDRPSVRPA
jgi:DNA invertase Pin-like site-specific DNA recombinase